MSYTTADRSPTPRRSRRVTGGDIAVLGVFLLAAAVVAAFGSVTTIAQVDGWYAHAPHVTWTPPGWAFGVVWSLLYLMIAVAGWLVWLRRWRVEVRPALGLYVAQFVLNALWTPLFFGGYPLIGSIALWLAVGTIVVLDLVVAATIAVFWPVSRAAALLLAPYLVWILYASTLNWGDAVLISLS